MPSIITAGTTTGTALNLTGDTSGELQIKTNNGSTTAMTITTAGNVGVGTASPTARLDITSASGAQEIYIRAAASTNAGLEIAGNGNTAGTSSFLLRQDTASNVLIYNRANAPMLFGTNGTERMRIDISGNVMAGVTTALGKFTTVGGTYQVALHDGNGSASSFGYLNYGGSSGALILNAYSTGGSTYQAFHTSNSGTNAERMRIDSAGNVGIGVTPSFLFDTASPSDPDTTPTARFGASRSFYIQPRLGGNDIYNAGIGFSGYFNSTAATFVLPAGRNTNGGAGISSSYNGDLDFYTYNGGSTAAASVALSTARRLRLNSTGALVLAGGDTAANGTGITFPATQNASSNANTLDDYEEGTFNPAPEGTSVAGTVTYVNRVGSYVKVGRQVTCWIHLNWNSGTGSGNLIITGLPFGTANNNNYSVPSLYFDSVSITSGNIFEAYVGPNGTRIDFIQYSSASSGTGTIAYDTQGVILAAVSYLAAS
jgi:hypothetical protein